MSTLLKKTGKVLAYSLATLTIIVATLISATQLFIPYLNKYKPNFEKIASELLQKPVKIQHLDISWHCIVPTLIFQQVSIGDNNKTSPFKVDAVQVRLQMFKSLWEKKPILAYVKLKGIDILAREDVQDKVFIEGIGNFSTPSNTQSKKTNEADFTETLYSIPLFELEAININYTALEGPSYSVTLNQISLENKELKHILKGKVHLNQNSPSNLTLNFRWRGELKEFDKISAKLYLDLEAVHLPQWLSDKTFQQVKVKEGLVSAKIRAAWSGGSLEKVQSQFQFSKLELYSLLTKKDQILNRLNGQLSWKREGDRQILEGEDIIIDLPGHLWPTTSFYFNTPLATETFNVSSNQPFSPQLLKIAPLNKSEWGWETHFPRVLQKDNFQLFAKIGYVDLKDLTGFVKMTDAIPANMRSTIINLNGSGEISKLEVDFQDSQHMANNAITAAFKNLSFDSLEAYPGLKNLTGELTWDGQEGSMQLESKNMALIYPSFFTKPLSFSSIQMKADFSKDSENNFVMTVDNFKLKNAFDIKGKFNLKMPANDVPYIDLAANFTLPDTRLLADYLFLKSLDPELKKWLQQAFHQGQINKGEFILNGRVSDFPFDKNNGKFLVSMDLEHLTFNYAPDWPSMVNTKGNVTFEGSAMHVKIASAKVLNISILNASGDIPYFGSDKPPMLWVKVPAISADLKDTFQMIYQSPLKHKLGQALANIELTGPSKLDLSLEIPLKTPEETKVIGDVLMKNARLHLKSFELEVDQLIGDLQFRENGISSKSLTGTFYDEPITINFNTTHASPKQSTIKALINSRVSSNVISKWTNHNPAIDKIIQGATAFTAEVLLDTSSQTPTTSLNIKSSLQGLAVDLPLNYGKKAADKTDFKLNIDIQAEKLINTKAQFGKNFSIAATLKDSSKGMDFYSGELRLGSQGTASIQSAPGLFISGKLNVLDWNEIQAYMAKADTTSTDTNSKDLIKLLRGIQFNINYIKGLGIKLTQVLAKVTQNKDDWLVNLVSSEASGDINIPKSFGNRITAKFKYINLIPEAGKTKNKTSISPKDLPPISIMINDFRYGTKSFGKISVNLEPNSSGLAIRDFRAESPNFNLNANGQWQNTRTNLQGNLTTKNIANFVSYYSSNPSNVIGSSGVLTYDLSWPGAPHDVSLSTVSGGATIKLTRGQIIGLDQATSAKMGFGRILNFLSIDSLWRRFSLNFSDLFEKGFPFDKLTGNFTLKNGNVFTENARLEGPLAKIELKGRIGLASKDYDATLSVTPYVTRSIPIVAALAINPLVGAAAWAVEKVASSAVSNATTQNYLIQGPWAKPVWKEK